MSPAVKTTFPAIDRYLPGLSGIRFEYVPMELVVVNLTVFHRPLTRRWILTGTLAAQAANASPTLTFPRAIRCFRSVKVMLLEWVVTTVTVKFVALVAVPLGVVTVIGPVVAPVGTFVTICVAVFDVIVAVTPLNFTEVAPVRFVPVMVTVVPTGPAVGVNEVIVGAAPPPWTIPLVTLWPKKQPFVQESAAVMVTELLRSTLPLSATAGAVANPHWLAPGLPSTSAPSVGSPKPVSTVSPINPKWQSSPSIVSSPFESTNPPIVDHAKSATKTPGLSGFASLYTVGRAVPVGQENEPFATVMVTPSAVPSYPTSVQSSLESMVSSPAVPAFSGTG